MTGNTPNTINHPKPQQNSIATQGNNDPNSGGDPTQGRDPNHSIVPKPQQHNEPTQSDTPTKGNDPTQRSDPHQESNPKQDNSNDRDSGQAAESKPNNDSDQVDTTEESYRNIASPLLNEANQTEHARTLNNFTGGLASNAPGTIVTATAGQHILNGR
ncbi:hypothetical protein IMSHALPRED_009331 [Imshaugia aleurites]|uniref:Uncharacterized protein n=1 Tax=Imshaugia aleurites TaxID=172621 RepID=A0A8H3G240_9LECA|nr:hypothetical protein IMSHALPRED_009331 [Imshaugia aleurites]